MWKYASIETDEEEQCEGKGGEISHGPKYADRNLSSQREGMVSTSSESVHFCDAFEFCKKFAFTLKVLYCPRNMKFSSATVLRFCHLRDTLSRRRVLTALRVMGSPADQKEIYDWMRRRKASPNLVTVYRVLETLEEYGVVHRHPSTGKFTLCSRLGEEGHHAFLSCRKCGRVKEFIDRALCRHEDSIAKEAGFAPEHHMSDIVGLCTSCQ